MEKLLELNHRKTQKEKNANDKQYYKTVLDSFSMYSSSQDITFLDKPDTRLSLKVNYDLYNNRIDVNEFNYVCKPFGETDIGELPANFVNRDIISGKIKAVEQMEFTEPFDYSIIAINEDATTRKEEEQFGRISQYVIDFVMMPIRIEAEKQMKAQMEGKENLSPEEVQQLQAQMQEQIKANTPDEVYKYMQREHQDPAEILAIHLINYLIYKEQIKRKFNKGWKHALISAHEIYHITHDADLQPKLEVVNPINVLYDVSDEVEFIEDLDEFGVEYKWSTNKVISFFGNELNEEEIDKLYERNIQFTFDTSTTVENTAKYHTVLHGVWVALRKVGFLKYLNDNEKIEDTIVSEEYEMNKQRDLEIEWFWIPEVHEGYRIDEDMYKRCGPVLGQVIDIDNLYRHKLPYSGVIYDNLNSEPVSLLDRMKHYQYLYDIIMYRLELLMASDKGKLLLFNIKALPKSAGIDITKFLYYAESLKIGFYDPNEEGNRSNPDAGSIAKEVDMSLASDIQKYIQLAEYVEKRCGESTGVTKNIEGQTPPNEAVRNAQQNYQQASGILQTYFNLHNVVKRNVLELLLEKTKALYSLNPKQKKLQYILDDMTLTMFEVDFDLLDNSSYGIFLANSASAKLAKDTVQQLAHAAMQNDRASLKDISKVIRATSAQEAEELLEKADREAQERLENLEKMKDESLTRDRQEKIAFEREKMAHEKEMMIIQENMKTEREVNKQLILTMGFNEDKDLDKDNTPDVLEVAKAGVDAEIKIRKQELEEKKFKLDEKKLAQQKDKDEKQLDIMKSKVVKNKQ